jgi:peptidoglycan/LPS O-acetylase OafA/YrhL
MEQVSVARWLFWAGVLVLVASIVLATFVGPQLNPPYGTEWNILPVFVILALVLLLASVVFGKRHPADAPEDRKEPSAGPR